MKKLVFVITFLIVLAFAIFGFITFFNRQQIAAISNFKECSDAGFPIMESYPARCMTPDKRSFTQELTTDEQQKLIPPTEKVSCGDGICQNVTCHAIGCPEAESPATCPIDCPYDR